MPTETAGETTSASAILRKRAAKIPGMAQMIEREVVYMRRVTNICDAVDNADDAQLAAIERVLGLGEGANAS